MPRGQETSERVSLIDHRTDCTQTTRPHVWRGVHELMQTCQECKRIAVADFDAVIEARSVTGRLVIPPASRNPVDGWPTHRAKRRAALRRPARQETD